MHVADQGRSLRKSIDYLLKAYSCWQQVWNPCLPIFYSLLNIDSINLLCVFGLWRASVREGSLGNLLNDYQGAVLADGDAADHSVQGSFCIWVGPMRDDDTLKYRLWLYGPMCWVITGTLQWRHNGRDRVSNHQPRECLLSRVIRRRSKKTSKLRVTGLCVGNSLGTGEFPAQRASNAENISLWWRHHGCVAT